jgi:flagellar biosynthesis protein FlhF
MKIKRFIADDLAGAVLALRREWGADAVILDTRRAPRPGWRRLFRRYDRMEVTAAVDGAAALGVAPVTCGTGSPGARGVLEGPGTGLPWVAPPPGGGARRTERERASALAHLGATAAPWGRLGSATGGGEFPAAPATALRPGPPPAPGPQALTPRLDLREAPAATDGVRRAVYGAGDGARGVEPVPLRPRPGTRAIVLLCGPTGSGKTVSAAKLAALLHGGWGCRVGLISTDVLHVGAVERLGAYARLLSLPYAAAPSAAALERALQRMQDRDVVLIDTAGCSARDLPGLEDLAAHLRVAARAAGAWTGPPRAEWVPWRPGEGVAAAGDAAGRAAGDMADGTAVPAGEAGRPPVDGGCPGRLEVHLVLEATARRAEAEALVAAYRARLEPTQAAARLLLTKVDACAAPSEVPGIARDLGLPLSYFAAGPRVPQDLAEAWPDRLAAALPAGSGMPA